MIGCDIIKISRIKNLRNLQRVFLPSEIEYCEQFNQNKYEHYAGFWALKESALKALRENIKNIPLSSIVISHGIDGEPTVSFVEKALEIFEKKFGKDYMVYASISHEKQGYAMAVCQIVKR